MLYAKLPQSVKAGEKLREVLSPGRYASSATNRCDDKGQLLPLGTNGDFDQFGEGGCRDCSTPGEGEDRSPRGSTRRGISPSP